jgi:hypothetical protein
MSIYFFQPMGEMLSMTAYGNQAQQNSALLLRAIGKGNI